MMTKEGQKIFHTAFLGLKKIDDGRGADIGK